MKSPSKNRNRNSRVRLESQGEGVGPPTPEDVERRAREIARIAGREPDRVTEDDRIRASRELHEEGIPTVSTEVRTDLVASRNPANPVAETGHRTENLTPPDEQEIVEKQVKEGVREAEHKRMLEASKRQEDSRP